MREILRQHATDQPRQELAERVVKPRCTGRPAPSRAPLALQLLQLATSAQELFRRCS